MDNDARSSAFCAAGTGPIPIIRGGTPAAALLIHLAIGFNLNSCAFSALINKTAAAPSFSPDEFPAVTLPSFRNAGRRDASFSKVVSRRGRSSCSTYNGVTFTPGNAYCGNFL